MPPDRTIEDRLHNGQLPVPADQTRLRAPDDAVPVGHTPQPACGHGFCGALDLNRLHRTQRGLALDEPCCRSAEHDSAGRRNRLHPLGHAHLLAHGGIAELSRADTARDHLPGVQPDPQPQLDAVTLTDVDGQAGGFLLNLQGSQTGPDGVVFQGDRGSEHRHDPVAGPLRDRAAVTAHHGRAAVGEGGHDLA